MTFTASFEVAKAAKAVYQKSTTTLTFYYDYESHTGSDYDVYSVPTTNKPVTAFDVLFAPVDLLSTFAVLRPIIEIVYTPINAVIDFAAVVLDLA